MSLEYSQCSKKQALMGVISLQESAARRCFAKGDVMITEPAGRVLERAWVDSVQLDFMVTGSGGSILGRPFLTLCVDEFSRYPLGLYFSFNPPSSHSILACLRHAVLPKNSHQDVRTERAWRAYGLPEAVIVGAEQGRRRRLEVACLSLGVSLIHARTTTIRARLQPLFSRLTTALRKRAGQHKASYGLELLRLDVHAYLMEDYAQQFTQALGTSPAAAWSADSDIHPPQAPPNLARLDALLGPEPLPQLQKHTAIRPPKVRRRYRGR